MTPATMTDNFKREIGTRALTLAILNNTFGTGIFVIPAIIANGLGAAAILAYVVCGGIIFLIALCFAELGSKTTSSGGIYTYVETAFGPFAGFLANSVYWFGASVLADAATANALADTLRSFFPALSTELFRIPFLIAVFGGLALLNIRSVKNGVRFVEFATLAKLLPVLVLIIIGARFVLTENLRFVTTPDPALIGKASLLLFFAFMGFESPLSNGGEIKNPRRTVPLGIFFGISIVLILYISIQLLTQGVLGNTITAHKDAPLAAVAAIVFGKAGFILLIIVTAISMLGLLGGEILSVPRIIFAGARDGHLPKQLALVHPRFATPYTAVAFYSALGLIFAISGGFERLAVLSSASILLIYLGGALAMMKQRSTSKDLASSAAFRVPGGVIVPLLAVVAIIILLTNLSQQELTGMCVLILIFSVIYLIGRFLRSRKRV